MIDYTLVVDRRASSVEDCCSYRGAGTGNRYGTDHTLVRARFKIHLTARRKTRLLGKFNVALLKRPERSYVQASADRVTVIFSTVFKDPDDVIIGKVFLQELTEVRRRIDRAPQVLYSQGTPPAELQGTDAAVGDNVAYITFDKAQSHKANCFGTSWLPFLSTPAPGEANPANKHGGGSLPVEKPPLDGRRSGIPGAYLRRWEKYLHFIGQLLPAQSGQPPANKVLSRPRSSRLIV
ncbi:unnamed protein product [Echinostoma caproni]|uniref:Arp2/3 complex 34 kDa subunit n=1 Tax=Echinostoma caproni TaxID=27848 RepID=A0A183AUH7_9TREM|nr:unnamed protein product [Echinostoma caproni]